MITTEDIGFVQQGWQCPICKRIYSPTTPMCMYCGGEQKTVLSTTCANATDYKKETAERAVRLFDWEVEKKW